MSKMRNQLNIGQHNNSLPFSPQTPSQLSFALEQQMTQSILGFVNSSDTSSSTMPYASFSTPANSDLLNINNGANAAGSPMPSQQSTNQSPLQQMQYMPNF